MSHRSQNSRQPAGGFTLVELMVVIAIIAVLAGLITFAASNALHTAKQTRIKMEVDGLDLAMKNFKTKYGGYPPTNLTFDPAQVFSNNMTQTEQKKYNLPLKQFIAKMFPRYKMQSQTDINNGTFNQLKQDLNQAGVITDYTDDNLYVDPGRALVFWLSSFNADQESPFFTESFVDANGNGVWDQGESFTDVARPPATSGNGIYDGATRTEALFDFDKTRLVQQPTDLRRPSMTYNTNYLVYTPTGGKGMPYLYFDAGAYGSVAGPVSYYQTNLHGVACPYVLDVNKNGVLDTATSNPNSPDTFANPDSFQIISAGQDGMYGAVNLSIPANTGADRRLYPQGLNYDPLNNADEDNVTNFSDKSSLGAARP